MLTADGLGHQLERLRVAQQRGYSMPLGLFDEGLGIGDVVIVLQYLSDVVITQRAQLQHGQLVVRADVP
ncbi:hypothetical protein D3C81_2261160 [compost metagenome]